MSSWLPKMADQAQYADKPGHTYIFDNTHSVRLAAGDTFVYLDKQGKVRSHRTWCGRPTGAEFPKKVGTPEYQAHTGLLRNAGGLRSVRPTSCHQFPQLGGQAQHVNTGDHPCELAGMVWICSDR